MDSYDAYKPLRNMLRQYNLRASLEDVWSYSQMLAGHASPSKVWHKGKIIPITEFLYPWDMPTIERELVLNANYKGTKRLNTFEQLSPVIIALREFGNTIAKRQGAEAAWWSLHPITHQQLPWQRQHELNSLMRYYKIFSVPEVEKLLVRETGIKTKDWFFMGFAAAGNMLRDAGINSAQDYRPFGIDQPNSRALFSKISTTFEDLKVRTIAEQRYDATWEFTWNPLTGTPLVSLDPAQPAQLHCPIPAFLLRRVSQGLYYEIANAYGFANPFGDSYQAYVGELLDATFPKPGFAITAENMYEDSRQLKHGVDWIVSDDQANLFIECKAKRMTQSAKATIDQDVINAQIDFLAKAVVQTYKNLRDALANKTHWEPNGLPVYLLVLTLENWYVFGPSVSLLQKSVEERMQRENLDLAWLTSMPYTVASCSDFETSSPTIAAVGIKKFFGKKFEDDSKNLMLIDFASQNFNTQYRQTARRQLFVEDWATIFPAHVLTFETKDIQQ